MATKTDAVFDVKLVKNSEAEWRKMSQQAKNTAKGGRACQEEFDEWFDADLEAAGLFAAVVAAAEAPPAALAAFLALLAAMKRSNDRRQKYFDCLEHQNDPRKAEVAKQLKTGRKIESVLVKEKDKVKKAQKK